jgi:hypothetical protein
MSLWREEVYVLSSTARYDLDAGILRNDNTAAPRTHRRRFARRRLRVRIVCSHCASNFRRVEAPYKPLSQELCHVTVEPASYRIHSSGIQLPAKRVQVSFAFGLRSSQASCVLYFPSSFLRAAKYTYEIAPDIRTISAQLLRNTWWL